MIVDIINKKRLGLELTYKELSDAYNRINVEAGMICNTIF